MYFTMYFTMYSFVILLQNTVLFIRYDLYDDAKYVAWLQKNYPESLPHVNQDGRQNNPDVDSEDDSDPNAECYLYDDDFLFDRSDPYGPFELSTSCGFSTPPSHTASALSSDSFNAHSYPHRTGLSSHSQYHQYSSLHRFCDQSSNL